MLDWRWGLAPRDRVAGPGSKPPRAARVKSPRGERRGKVAARPRQVRLEKTNKDEPLMTCRELYQERRNRAGRSTREEIQRMPADWLDGVRHKGGVSSSQAPVRNVRTCRPDVKRRARAEGLREGASINAGHRGGATRSSADTSESWGSEGVASSSQRWRSTVNSGRNR